MALHPAERAHSSLEKGRSELDPIRRALQENEDWHRDLVEHSEDLLCIHDLQGRLLAINPSPARVLGYSVEELLQIPMREIIAPEFRDQFDGYMKQIEQTGESRGFMAVLTRSGERRIWQYHNTLRTQGVATPIVRGLARDVTEQKLAEKRLLRAKDDLTAEVLAMNRLHEFSNRLLAHTALQPMLEETLDAIMTVQNADFGLFQTYHSDTGTLRTAAQRGFQPEFLNLFSVVHDGTSAWGRALQKRVRVLIEDVETQPGLKPDRQIAAGAGFRAVQSTPLFRRNGEPLGVISTQFRAPHQWHERELQLTDLFARQAEHLIERRRAEERVEEYERVVEALDEMIVVVDREYRYVIANHAFLKYRELNREQVVGHLVEEVVGKEAFENVIKLKMDACFAGDVVRYELGYRFPNMGERDLYASYFPIEGPNGIDRLALILQDITERKRAEEELRLAKEKLAEEKVYLEEEIDTELGFGEIIGQSRALRAVLEQVAKVADTDATVLIQGETGTGKELVARAIHNTSKRRLNTFIKLNCAAIPSGLLESELFGHEKGAFTGAVTKKIGRLELADQGTLFLDEIGEIPMALQPKLLRVLQDQEFERLGSTHTVKVNFRLIAATNQDLSERVKERHFRSDLYYRLNVFPVRVPALRERREDIPLLVEHFVRKCGKRMNKVIRSIPAKTMEALQQWNWAGNIRELENFVERSVILTHGSVLQSPLKELEFPTEAAADDTLQAMEREHIVRALRQSRGRLGGAEGAADRLGMNRTTLQSKLKRLGISPQKYRG